MIPAPNPPTPPHRRSPSPQHRYTRAGSEPRPCIRHPPINDDFAGCRILVTGGSRRIGAATAQAKGVAPKVRINTVIPGSVNRPGGTTILEEIATAMCNRAKAMGDALPMGRSGDSRDIAEAVVSDWVQCITGANYTVDGGQQSLCEACPRGG